MENRAPRLLALVIWLSFLTAAAIAHPMGNFSVNHYAHIEPRADSVEILYVLDLAEIPTFELLQKWNLASDPAQPQFKQQASAQAREWIRNLAISANGRSVEPRIESTEAALAEGAGGMKIMRVTTRLHLPIAAATLQYEDRNYAERAGWKEIVIAAGPGAMLEKATQTGRDRSQALTAYPQDPTIAPPQDLRASLEWTLTGPRPVRHRQPEIVPAPSATPAANPPAVRAPVPAQQTAAGTLVRGDFLSQLLNRREITWRLALLGLAVAFGLGAIHALSPGHGKTIVAAYLVGTRGTVKHAIFLGGMVTFTHTISVFFLGFVTLYLSQYVLPEKIYPVLGAISGISIVWIGAILLYKRAMRLRGHTDDHHHVHDHSHSHDHDHGDGHRHSHVPEGDVTLGSLIALGASGGLVPCPSALVLLLSSIALGRIGLGLVLLVSFSAGLAMVLMSIGLLVLYAKHLLPDQEKASRHPAFRLIPVFSAAIIVCIGLVMTAVSLGVVRPDQVFGLT
jgi:ABC-type nickel/cobalt efflux system permease component RcnA